MTEIETLSARVAELEGELLSAAMESTPTAQIERQRKTILDLQDVLREARDTLERCVGYRAIDGLKYAEATLNRINAVL